MKSVLSRSSRNDRRMKYLENKESAVAYLWLISLLLLLTMVEYYKDATMRMLAHPHAPYTPTHKRAILLQLRAPARNYAHPRALAHRAYPITPARSREESFSITIVHMHPHALTLTLAQPHEPKWSHTHPCLTALTQAYPRLPVFMEYSSRYG